MSDGSSELGLKIETPNPSFNEAIKKVLKPAGNPNEAGWVGPDGRYYLGSREHSSDARKILAIAEPGKSFIDREDLRDYVIYKAKLGRVTNYQEGIGIDLSIGMPDPGVDAVLNLGYYNPGKRFDYAIAIGNGEFVEGVGLENLKTDLNKVRLKGK